MAGNIGMLNKAKGFGAVFKSNTNGVITAEDGTKLLAKGWQQDEKTGAITKGTSFTDKMARNPIKTGLIGTGVALGGGYAYNAYAGGGDSFTPSGGEQ